MLSSDILQLCALAADSTRPSIAPLLQANVRQVTIIGPEVDLTTPAVHQWYPALAGFYFQPMTARWRNTATAGAVTAGPTTRAGNDGTNNNIVQSSVTPTTADFSGAAAPGHNSNLSPGRSPEINLATPINVEVQNGATGTGGFVWKAKLCITGWLFPA